MRLPAVHSSAITLGLTKLPVLASRPDPPQAFWAGFDNGRALWYRFALGQPIRPQHLVRANSLPMEGL
jgi:hypothetical protein